PASIRLLVSRSSGRENVHTLRIKYPHRPPWIFRHSLRGSSVRPSAAIFLFPRLFNQVRLKPSALSIAASSNVGRHGSDSGTAFLALPMASVSASLKNFMPVPRLPRPVETSCTARNFPPSKISQESIQSLSSSEHAR